MGDNLYNIDLDIATEEELWGILYWSETYSGERIRNLILEVDLQVVASILSQYIVDSAARRLVPLVTKIHHLLDGN